MSDLDLASPRLWPGLRRAGLLRVYAGCIEGHEQLWNSRIEGALQDGEGPE